MKLKFLALLLCLNVSLACQPTVDFQKAEGLSDAFVQAYYVDAKLEDALHYCEALACENLHQEIQLRKGQVIDASTRHPTIEAHLIKTLEAGDNAKRLIYELTIKPADMEPIVRRAYVKVTRRDNRWWVSQFAELKDRQE